MAKYRILREPQLQRRGPHPNRGRPHRKLCSGPFFGRVLSENAFHWAGRIMCTCKQQRHASIWKVPATTTDGTVVGSRTTRGDDGEGSFPWQAPWNIVFAASMCWSRPILLVGFIEWRDGHENVHKSLQQEGSFHSQVGSAWLGAIDGNRRSAPLLWRHCTALWQTLEAYAFLIALKRFPTSTEKHYFSTTNNVCSRSTTSILWLDHHKK